MKVTIVGCPSKPDLAVDVPTSTAFGDVLKKAESVSGAKLSGFYALHIADDKGAAVMEAPLGDTLADMGLSGATATLRLVPSGSASPRAPPTYKDRLTAFYQKYDPSKIPTIDKVLEKFAGKEEAVIKKLVSTYGPEPEAVSAAPTPAATPRAAGTHPVTPSSGASGAPSTYKERLTAFYQKYDPSKIPTIDKVLEKFAGKEEAVIKKLVSTYGPEPEAVSAAPPAAVPVAAEEVSSPPKVSPKVKVPPPAALVKAPPKAPPVAVSAGSSGRTHRDRMIAFYQQYDPVKVGSVDDLLKKYAGKEEQIIAKMVEKYGPEPSPEAVVSGPPPASAQTPPATPRSQTPVSTPTKKQPAAVNPRVRARVLAYCESMAASLVPKVDDLITKYHGNEDEIMEKLVKKYGPEPTRPASEVQGDGAPEEVDSMASSPRDDAPSGSPKARAETIAPEVPGLHTAPPPPTVVAPPPPSKERYLPALRLLVQRMESDLNTQTRRGVFGQWHALVAAQRAARAATEGVFKGDGPYTAYDGDGNAVLTVPSTVAYYTVTSGTSSSTALSLALGGALQGLIASSRKVAPSCAGVAADLSASGLVVRDTSEVAASIVSVTQLLEGSVIASNTEKTALSNELLETKATLEGTCVSLSDLRLYVEELEGQAVKDQASLLRLGNVESDLGAALEREVRYRQDIDILRQAQVLEEERNSKTKADNIRLRKELSDERKGLPSDMELLLSQKDASIASLQQELARVRSKARAIKGKEDAMHETIQSLNDKVVQLEVTRGRRGASASASPRAAGPPRIGGAPIGLASSGRALSNAVGGGFSPTFRGRSAGRLADDFEPSARAPAIADADATYLAEEDDPTLDVEVQKRAFMPDRGGCPHCLIPLTPFMGDRYGAMPEDASKVAFCFSCRRSFTGLDLARRDAKARSAKSALGSKGLSQPR